MRDILMFAIFLGLVPYMIKRPAIGAIVFMWLSVMNPHRLAYGFAYDFPFAAVTAGITVLSTVFSKYPRKFVWTPITVILVLFSIWATFSTLQAMQPTAAWPEWRRVMKTFLMVALTIMVINTESDVKKLIWALALSLGFFGAKGGLFTILSGGSYRVYGPSGSYIGENNSLALALVMAVPIIWYLRQQVERKILRRGIEAIVVLTVISAAGSYSRGALLAGGAMFLFLWLKSNNKWATGLIIILLIPLLLFVMPDQWDVRMSSIGDYQQDDSALGRINAWYFAIAVAARNIFGGGFMVFSPSLFLLYAPVPWDYHAAHSIYFQVLGEHGFPGVALFLALLFATWRSASRMIQLTKNRPDLKWAKDFAAMCQASQVGYMVGGAFLSLAYYDYFYYLAAALVIIHKIISEQVSKKPPFFANKPAVSERTSLEKNLMPSYSDVKPISAGLDQRKSTMVLR